MMKTQVSEKVGLQYILFIKIAIYFYEKGMFPLLATETYNISCTMSTRLHTYQSNKL